MDYFDLKASGSCDMEIFGECDQATFDIMGGCEIDAKDLRTNKMNLTIYGTSFVECNVIELMNGVVGGLSRLQYWGNPDQNFVRKADQATIERFGDR